MRHFIFAITFVAVAGLIVAAALAPPAIKEPGTQPEDNVAPFSHPASCSCHSGTINPQLEPVHTWQGSMMSHAMRDPLYWATVAIAEQDFLPGSDPETRGGAGDLCLRCHGPNGWLQGRSEPTDGSAFIAEDVDGVECEFCHMLVDPDQALNIDGTAEVHATPFEPFDETTGEGYYGGGQYVINGGGARLGPYADASPNHAFLVSGYVREGEFCGTCHDVSNPVVGDLAHNNGTQLPLAPGSFSGDPASDVSLKAAFNNAPHGYGVVERTFSEWKGSALDTFRVNDFPTLPADLRVVGGSLEMAYQRSVGDNPNADYADGTPRTFTCQTCHLYASTGKGAAQGNVPVRTDLPVHDLTGGSVWMPDVVQYQDTRGTLRYGAGLTADQISAMQDGKARALTMLQSAANLEAVQEGADLRVTVTNLTGHKLISGYPEGRRMWLHLEWKDSAGTTIHTNGAYGSLQRSIDDLDGVSHDVLSLLAPDSTVVFEVHGAMDQEWAQQLIDLGYPTDLPLGYDRLTDAVEHTLGELAGSDPGTAFHTFHFALNNTVIADNRIPPYGLAFDEALTRSILPVPQTQYGDPGAGGTFDHFAVALFTVPEGAESVTVTLLYQQTSWEYIQFLYLGNDTLSPFLGNEGINLLDAWANTGMAEPITMATTTVLVSTVIFKDGFENGDTIAWSGSVP